VTRLLAPTETLASHVDSAIADILPDHALGHNQLCFVRTIELSVRIQDPLAGVIVASTVPARIVGGSGALAYLRGRVLMAFKANACVAFIESLNAAVSTNAFNGVALGPTYGFVSAWILLLSYVTVAVGA
jgi:amino acid transporter